MRKELKGDKEQPLSRKASMSTGTVRAVSFFVGKCPRVTKRIAPGIRNLPSTPGRGLKSHASMRYIPALQFPTRAKQLARSISTEYGGKSTHESLSRLFRKLTICKVLAGPTRLPRPPAGRQASVGPGCARSIPSIATQSSHMSKQIHPFMGCICFDVEMGGMSRSH